MREPNPSTEARLERERDYHNQRFTEETRVSQGKYYAAIAACRQYYAARRVELARGADVLEYGCAEGKNCLTLASDAQSIHGIDISDVAIATARSGAAESGLDNADFHVMNAEAMDFEDNSFDLVFGTGIIHHLDVDKCYRELKRVLRPGGRVLFMEPLGHNPLIELYRRLTPQARTEDEHPLVRSDLKLFQNVFAEADVRFYGLATLAAVPFRNTAIGRPLHKAFYAADTVLLALPGVRWMAWFCCMEGQSA